ncbi:Phenylacetate-coenzyme A ligase [Rubripirellula lacrimiformis]|uniref:Phenylacetate-coenzyme A ligase n=1 Tax=Rubripirellula lacrimiformis TaxID=1930273 RepID=A0A517N6Q5_9BACT|nr:AMP-binding protein [Rubripirellula lacrimiformis]QDT02812.1 Phenylacetate-coenzyme A ligase [Rubripirellula lacrimiformis]
MNANTATASEYSLSLGELQSIQLTKLNALLDHASQSPFYADRLHGVSRPLQRIDEIRQIPALQKSDLIASQPGMPGRIFELPKSQYTRLHQTSGTRGFPMAVLDTVEDWQWWLRCWDFVLDAADVTAQDVALMAFSFGPFIGFWTAHDALVKRRSTVVPGGGISSEHRLRMIDDYGCTLMCCTPTYALHLVDVAQRAGINLAENSVNRIIVAGEPGGSIPAVRSTIESAWGARVIDHTGASEVGAWGFGSRDGRGIHVIETEFIAEVLRFQDDDPTSGEPVADGETGELVLTNLGRLGGPAIRYRTGDVVKASRPPQRDTRFLWLDGGVIGRSDDMIVIRGVNVFPSSVEAIIRQVEPTAEFRMIVTRDQQMDQLAVEIETDDSGGSKLAGLLRDRLAMRIGVRCVPAESLPRFQAKAKRLIDRRDAPAGN